MFNSNSLARLRTCTRKKNKIYTNPREVLSGFPFADDNNDKSDINNPGSTNVGIVKANLRIIRENFIKGRRYKNCLLCALFASVFRLRRKLKRT